MKTFFADSNFLIRFLINDVVPQALEAKEKLERARAGAIKIKVAQITIFEIAFTLEKFYKLEKSKTVGLLKSVVGMPYLDVEDRESFLEALGLYERVRVDFVDIFIYCKAGQNEAEILSFDKDFTKLSRTEPRKQ